MSGIFKSVKKVFSGKKSGKFWKAIVIAAAIYFGGAYLLSAMGGAGAQASMGVAKSMTHSGNVWKNALSSMLTGGGSTKSAAAYAKGVYKARNLSVSSQVMSGTNSVKTLSHLSKNLGVTNLTEDIVDKASTAGYKSALDGNKVLREGFAARTEAAMVSSDNEIVRLDESFGIGDEASVEPSVDEETTAITDPRLKNIEKVSEVYEVDQITAPTVEQTSIAATSATAQPAAGSEDAQYTGGEDTGEIIDAGGGDAEGSLSRGVIDKSQQGIEKLLTTLLTQRDENTQVRLAEIKRQTKKDKISLGIQGAGLLLNAIGEMQKAKAAESIRTMKIPDEWKKSGVPGIDWKGIKF
tara:strand:- start:3296 stop:4351 length:1056 start_codon:yes stop_codon:yes gene_type:complete